ncbi:phosphoglucomutase/phosphomannomutase, C-terminal domain protein, partial [Escherichia coli 8.0586]
MKPNV